MKDAFKTIASVCAIVGFAIGGVAAINRYFAKQATVDIIGERMDIGATEDRIRYQEQKIERIKARATFQARPEPPTPTETELLDIEQKRLAELEREREQKQQMYRQRR